VGADLSRFPVQTVGIAGRHMANAATAVADIAVRLTQQSHEPDEQRATQDHRPVPDIQIEKPAVGRHKFEQHERPLWNLLPAHCSAYCAVPLLPA